MPEPISKQGNADANRSAGPQSNPIQSCGIEVSSRICLARNLATYPFFDACSVTQRQEIFQTLTNSDWLRQNAERFAVVDCLQLKLHEQQFLQELQAIVGFGWVPELEYGDWEQAETATSSPSPSSTSSPASSSPSSSTSSPSSSTAEEIPALEAVVESPEMIAESSPPDDWVVWNSPLPQSSIHVLLNGEDHLRIEAWSGGNQLIEQWQRVSATDDQLQREFGFAFHPQFGFLTASPGDVGTGLRAGLLLHLPALVNMAELPQITASLTRKNVTLREAFGDPGAGDFFRLSNLGTLGASEEQLLSELEQAAAEIVAAEQQARLKWRTFHSPELKRQTDQMLRHLRSIPIAELDFINLEESLRWKLLRDLSRLRLAQQMQLVPATDTAFIGEQFHRVHLEGLLKSAIAREDYRTASQLRDRIKVLGGTA